MPGNAKADFEDVYARGVELFLQHDFEHALQDFIAATELNSQDERGWEMLGCTYGNLKRYKESLAALERAQQLGHQCASCWMNRAIAHREQRHFSEAIGALDRMLELDPENADGWLQKAALLAGIGEGFLTPVPPERAAQAVKCLLQAETLDPAQGERWVLKGEILCRAGEAFQRNWPSHAANCFAEAAQAFDRALEEDSEEPRALYYRGRLALEQAPPQVEIARRCYQKLVERDAEDSGAWYGLARAHHAAGEETSCVSSLRRALELDSDLYHAGEREFGECFTQAIAPRDAERDEEIRRLMAATAAQPADFPLWEKLARLLTKAGRLNEALRVHEKLKKNGHTCFRCQDNLVDIYLQLGQVERAAAIVRETLNLYPDDPQVWVRAGAYYGDFRGETGTFRPRDACLPYFEKAIALDPECYEAWYHMAADLYMEWKWKKWEAPGPATEQIYKRAIEAAERAMQLRSDDARLWRLRGFLADEATVPDLETARVAFTRYAELHSEHPEPWSRLGKVLDKLGRKEESRAAFNRATMLDR
jgi:tetratricopeptide (TPR) repeat protein